MARRSSEYTEGEIVEIYKELEYATARVIENIDESDTFKRLFQKIIENYYNESSSMSDIENVIQLQKYVRD